ncbi:MAG: hypothetical protein Q8K63_12760 [Acidimicrobiales bacterium]|nr:hypothetical protein [Acidimicrobiales bacterium]
MLIDVLANDTDADGDQLVFQILSTEGGSSEIDDGDTPTDSSDDRLAFTPVDPPVETATIEYQSLDPQGGFSTTTVTVAINPDAVLPDGVRSALASDPAPEGAEGGRCGDTADTTSTTLDSGPVGPETEAVDTTTTIVEEVEDDSTDTTRRRTGTTRRPSSSNRTTTTRKPSSSPGTTQKPSTGPGTTDAPSVTAPGEGGGGGATTTQPTSPPPEPDPDCGTPQTPGFEECIRDKYGSAPPP